MTSWPQRPGRSMTRARAGALAIGALAAATVGAMTACSPPCALDADCPEGSGCRDGFCATECARDEDCPLGTDCTPNHLCGPSAAGEVTWASPAADSTVETSFDAELEVSFRAASAILRIVRSDDDPGDACAPFVPVERVLEGDVEQYLTHKVTVPGLRALGERFTLAATLQSAGGASVGRIALRGAPSGLGGARFTQPDEERAYDAANALTIPVGAELDGTRALVSIHVEPLGGVPGPVNAIGAGLSAFSDQPVLLARGPQILWIDADGTRCGRGVEGVGDDTTGLELGLRYRADSPTQLGLRLLVESEGSTASCGFLDPGTLCEAVRETPAPALEGEQVMRVPLVAGLAQIAVVPGAAGGYVTAEIRVSLDGRHLGWLGPFPIETGAGQAWLAGQVVVGEGEPRLMRTDEVTIGAPW